MRKILLYILLFVILCFVIPIIFTQKFEVQKTTEVASVNQIHNNEQIENQQYTIENSSYDYKQYNTIKLLHAKTGKVEELPLDEYLYGVVSAEMPASFEEEALKAQAVVARTYTIYKIQNNSSKHANADICDDSNCCQAWISKEDRLARWEQDKALDYWNKIVASVESTKGQIVTYEGKPINAFFHANSGGKTETTINVWGRSKLSIFANSSNFRRRCI